MMHFGNDVIYYEKDDQLAIFRAVKDSLFSKLKSLPEGPKLCPYVRLIVEPMFAYNHFVDDGDDLEINEYSSEVSSQDSHDNKKKKKKVVIKGDGFQVKVDIE